MRKFNSAVWIATILSICCGVAHAEDSATTNSNVKKAHTTELPDFDRIVIYALTGKPFRGEEGFPIRPYEGQVCRIKAQVEVTGKHAESICKMWRQLDYESAEIVFCHLPPYGFRFYRGDEMMFETSMCWECNNFYGPDENGNPVWYQFKIDEQSLRLRKVCRTYMRKFDPKVNDANKSNRVRVQAGVD